jgi:phosphoribosylanthranilate isomerase
MCGTTNAEDARVAACAGVDALGFIFVEKSPRFISVEKASKIISDLPPFIDPVGVFVDRNLHEVGKIAKEIGLSYLQLHGSEGRDYCLQASQMACPCKVVKVIRVGEQTRAVEFEKYNDVVQGFLLDTYVKGQAGGTGETFDWQLIERLRLKRPVILAGGLRPENIQDAVRAVKPWAVDVNSGVEIKPGIKDHAALHEFVRQVRLADMAEDSPHFS